MTLALVFDSGFAFTVALVGILVVFGALVIIALILTIMPLIFKIRIKKIMVQKGHKPSEDCCKDVSGEVSAAISLALHLYFSELHDQENMVMTIKKVSRRYSPWSSKIYGLNNYYFRK